MGVLDHKRAVMTSSMSGFESVGGVVCWSNGVIVLWCASVCIWFKGFGGLSNLGTLAYYITLHFVGALLRLCCLVHRRIYLDSNFPSRLQIE